LPEVIIDISIIKSKDKYILQDKERQTKCYQSSAA
jgi:hypothetical protein